VTEGIQNKRVFEGKYNIISNGEFVSSRFLNLIFQCPIEIITLHFGFKGFE